MDGLKKLHDSQDEFIKKTLQEDKIVSQPIFDSFSGYMNKTNVKVKKYSYKQQKIIFILLLLLALSVGLNIYFAVTNKSPITITNIFGAKEDTHSLPSENEPENEEQASNKVENIVENIVNNTVDNTVENQINLEEITSENTVSTEKNTNTIENKVEETKNNVTNTINIDKSTKPKEEKEPVNTTITPALFTDVNTTEIKAFVDQFAIGINKLNLEDTSNLESNTILLYITQQYFSKKASSATSLKVDANYASSRDNFHKFLNELTINNYSGIDHLESYDNYIGYISRSKSYAYGNDYSTLAKEKYKCEEVTITNKENNVYTAKAKVTRTYEGENSTYEVTFTFKENSNYKYQKYKLLSLKSKITSSNVDNVIHLVGK